MNKWWAAGLFASWLIMDTQGTFLVTWSDVPPCSKYCEYFIPRRRLCYLLKRRSSEATETHGSVVVASWRGLRQGSPVASLRATSHFVWSLLRAAGRKKCMNTIKATIKWWSVHLPAQAGVWPCRPQFLILTWLLNPVMLMFTENLVKGYNSRGRNGKKLTLA